MKVTYVENNTKLIVESNEVLESTTSITIIY